MNDMWYLFNGHHNGTSSNNYRGTSSCLSVAIDGSTITFLYDRITNENGVWTYSHNADIENYGRKVLMEHPAVVVIDRKAADHIHDYRADHVVAPTCLEGGNTIEKCSVCDRVRSPILPTP